MRTPSGSGQITKTMTCVLLALENYRLKNGIYPYHKDIAEYLGLNISTIAKAIYSLRRKGYLNLNDHKKRGVEIIPGKKLSIRWDI